MVLKREYGPVNHGSGRLVSDFERGVGCHCQSWGRPLRWPLPDELLAAHYDESSGQKLTVRPAVYESVATVPSSFFVRVRGGGGSDGTYSAIS